MKKKLTKAFLGTIGAMIIAVIALSVSVFANFTYNGINYTGERQYPSSDNLYASESVYSNGTYWYPNIEAYYEFNKTAPKTVRTPMTDYSSDYTYFNYNEGNYKHDNFGNSPYVYQVNRVVKNDSGSGVAYRDGNKGLFYPTQSYATQNDVDGSNLREYPKRGDGNYFNKVTGRYYTSLANAVAVTNNINDILIGVGNLWYDRNYTEIYKNSGYSKYYLSEAEAAAVNSNGKVIRSVTPTQGYYFNTATGTFWVTAELAAAQSYESDVIRATSFSFTNGIYDMFGNSYFYGYPLYTPGNVTSADAYAQSESTPAASQSIYDTNSTAVLRSNYSYSGWSSIAGLVSRASAGSNVTILTNQDTYVSSTFMKAVAGRDINIYLINPNGSQISFSGLDVYNAIDMPISVVYSAQIPQYNYESTISRAKADTGSAITIGTETDLGAVIKVKIRFNSSNAGDDVALYAYNSANNATALVDSQTIGDDGVAAFEIRKGGQFVTAITNN
jgi:hypothetical protein